MLNDESKYLDPEVHMLLKAKRAYAIMRGGQRGSSDRQHDSVLVVDCPVIDEEAEDEGLFSLVSFFP